MESLQSELGRQAETNNLLERVKNVLKCCRFGLILTRIERL